MNAKRIYVFGFLAIMFLALSCGDKTPNKEFTQAKQNIYWANEVNAKLYDEENLNTAKDLLYKAHEAFVINEKYDESVKLSKESLKFSKKAIEKSLPLFANEEMKKAKKEVIVAKKLYADGFDKKDFDLALSYIAKAEEDYKNNKYYSFEGEEFAYRKSQKAYKLLISAEMMARKEIPNLQKRIVSIEDILKEAAKYNANKYARDKYELANNSLNNAKDLLKDNNIRESIDKINESEKLAKDLLMLAKKMTADQKVKDASEVYNKAKNVKYAMEFKEELLSAEEALKSSQSEFGKENYEASMDFAEECISRSNAVILMSEKRAKEQEQKQEQEQEKEVATKDKKELSPKKVVVNSPTSPVKKDIVVSKPPLEVKDLGIEEKLKKLDNEYSKVIHKKVKTYRVVRRKRNTDCLWRIASYKRIYRNARLWPLIYSANQDKVKNPDLIFPGQILIIPPLPDFFKERVKAVLKEVRATNKVKNNTKNNTKKLDKK